MSARVQEVEQVSADGANIHARWCYREGAQAALLYCHGNAGNLFQRAGDVAPVMDALNVSVLIFDYPGYGRSSGKPLRHSPHLPEGLARRGAKLL